MAPQRRSTTPTSGARATPHPGTSPADDLVRRNLDVTVALRNKIEHRFAARQAAMSLAFSGHAQALLLNYEAELCGQFGADASLATRLRFPVFVGSFSADGEEALLRLCADLPASLRTFAASFASGLDPAVADDSRFEFRLRLVPELAPRDPDALALQFTRLDDMTPAQRSGLGGPALASRPTTERRG